MTEGDFIQIMSVGHRLADKDYKHLTQVQRNDHLTFLFNALHQHFKEQGLNVPTHRPD